MHCAAFSRAAQGELNFHFTVLKKKCHVVLTIFFFLFMLQFPAKTSVSQQIKMAEGGSGNMRPGHSRSKRKGRSRRGKKTNHRIQLSQEDIEYLKLNTKFDEQEIREWFKGFKVIEKTSLKSFSASKCNVAN